MSIVTLNQFTIPFNFSIWISNVIRPIVAITVHISVQIQIFKKEINEKLQSF